jgi:hypothetical protein
MGDREEGEGERERERGRDRGEDTNHWTLVITRLCRPLKDTMKMIRMATLTKSCPTMECSPRVRLSLTLDAVPQQFTSANSTKFTKGIDSPFGDCIPLYQCEGRRNFLGSLLLHPCISNKINCSPAVGCA